jgi:hypothetical protein
VYGSLAHILPLRDRPSVTAAGVEVFVDIYVVSAGAEIQGTSYLPYYQGRAETGATTTATATATATAVADDDDDEDDEEEEQEED